MPGPEGEIYYSPRADRFYQAGRRGAVSRESALPSLRYDPDAGRFRDQRGRLIDDELLTPVDRRVQSIAGLDAEGRPFIKTVMVDDKLTQEAARNTKLAGNEQIVVRIVVKTEDGIAHSFSVSSQLGKTPDLDALEELATRRARAILKDQKYDIDTPTVSGATINVSYLRRRVAVE